MLSLSCQKDSTAETADENRPDLVCPGDAGCEDAEGPLQAGAAAVSITPQCFETWTDLDGDQRYKVSKDEYADCGCDRLCPEDPGYPGPDEGEADGSFTAMWMGGFSVGHPAQGIHDDLWARTVILERGSTRVALVSVDLVGFFNEDVIKVREALAAENLQVDHLLVSSTHTHEGPDTMGLWGKAFGKSGYQDFYVEQVRAGIAEISGNNLLADDRSVTKVTLNGIEAIVDSSNASTIIVETAALAIGADQTGTVEITLDNGQTIESVALEDGSFVKEFTYKVAGEITNVFPVQGQANTQVTITGTTLLGQGASSASVTLAGVVATVVTENNSVVVVDAGVSAATAAGAVVITADTGAVVSVASTFGYVAVGNITSVSPASGQLSTKVTIAGAQPAWWRDRACGRGACGCCGAKQSLGPLRTTARSGPALH